jgi:hypothetical protein
MHRVKTRAPGSAKPQVGQRLGRIRRTRMPGLVGAGILSYLMRLFCAARPPADLMGRAGFEHAWARIGKICPQVIGSIVLYICT